MRCEGESRFAVDLEWIATASILVRVEVEYGLAAVIPLCRDVVRMRRFFFGGVTAQYYRDHTNTATPTTFFPLY